MRTFTYAFVLLAIASSGSAQNLLNGDFEVPVSGNSVPNWNWSFGAKTLESVEKAASPGDVYNGDRSLKITPIANYSELGKRWTQVQKDDFITGVFRVRLSHTELQNHVRFVAYVQGDGGVRTIETPTPTVQWQEITVSHTLPLNASPTGFRFGIEMRNWNNAPAGAHLLVDFVVFGGTDPVFNGGVYPDHEVTSSVFSLLVKGDTGELEHLRRLPPAGGVLRDNLLADAPLSELWRIDGYHGSPGVGNHTKWEMESATGSGPTSITVLSNGISVRRNHASEELDVTVEITTSGGPEITFSPDIGYIDTDAVVRQIQIPMLRVTNPIGSSLDDDRFFSPGGDGSVSRPADLGSGAMTDYRDYPGAASMQFLAFYDDSDGFSMTARDTSGEAKAFRFEYNGPGGSMLQIMHLTPEEKNRAIASFPVVIEPCKGSWMDAAKNYRTWALQQHWALPANILPRAAWVDDRPTSLFARLMPTQSGVEIVPLVPKENWTNVAEAWKTQLGSPIAPLFEHFEQHGIYISGPNMLPLRVVGTNYQELYSRQQIEDAWQDLVGAGHVPTAMVASLKWAYSRDQCPEPLCQPYPAAPCPERASPPSQGNWSPSFDPALSNWFTNNPPADQVCIIEPGKSTAEMYPAGPEWNPIHGRMCPWHWYSRLKFSDYAHEMAFYGNRLFLLDQMIGGGTKPCYSTHPPGLERHPFGFGRWMYNSVKQLMTQIRAAGKAITPDFEVTLEGQCELWIPFLGVSGARTETIHGFPAAGYQAWNTAGETWGRIVPAFQFVYSSRIQSWTFGHTIDTNGSFVANEARALAPVQVGRAYVSASWMRAHLPVWQLLSLAGSNCQNLLPMAEPKPANADSNQLDLLTDAVKLGQGVAKAFFQQGEMVRPEGEFIQDLTVLINGVSVSHPEVAISGWKLNSEFGIALANCIYDQAVMINLPTHLDGQDLDPSASTLVYQGDQLIAQGTYGAMRLNFPIAENAALFVRIVPGD